MSKLAGKSSFWRNTSGRLGSSFLKAKKHHHKPRRAAESTPYDGCVAPGHCNPKSHDGVCITETCECGYVRLVNKNGGYIEKGRWTRV